MELAKIKIISGISAPWGLSLKIFEFGFFYIKVY